MKKGILVFLLFLIAGCAPQTPKWHLALRHDDQGLVDAGSVDDLIAAVRLGCEIRVAWGARRRADPTRTIEHVATPIWVSVRDSKTVEVQLGDFLINLGVLGEPAEEHPQREPYGGTEKAVIWRANLKSVSLHDATGYFKI